MSKTPSSKPGLGFDYLFYVTLMAGGPILTSVLIAPKGERFDLKRFYLCLSLSQWLFGAIHWMYARGEVDSARENGVADFWLDEEEVEIFEYLSADGQPPDEGYAALPLVRRRVSTINHGFCKAFWPAMLAWALAAVAGLFLSAPSGDMPASATEVGLYRWVATVTPANLAALAVGPPIYGYLE